nr:Palmitoyltransferase zdhhc18 [Polyrhizophydium stewartii]
MEQPSRAALPSDSMDGSSRASLAPAASQDRLLDGRPLWLDELQEPPVPSKPGPAHSPWRALAKQAAGAGAAAVAATGTSAGAGTGGAPAAAVKDPQRGSPEARSRSASASTSLSGGDPAAGGGSSSRRGCFGTLGLRFVRLVRKMLVDSWKRADQSIFLLALALIVVPSALTVVYAVPFLRSDGFLWLCVLFGVLFGSTILLLFATSFTDPGFVPKNMDPPPSEINRDRVVTVNGKEVTVKYCNTCGSWRPPRTSHCAFCDRCVEGHDHHCPWMGTCVGHRNYRFFYFFLISVISLIAVSVAAHTLVIIRRPTTNIAQDNAASIAVIVLCGIVAWGVLLLNGYHTWLIAQGLSTHEQIRSGVSVFGSIQDHPNPYRRSTPWGNCAWALCRPIERSREFDVYLDVSAPTHTVVNIDARGPRG